MKIGVSTLYGLISKSVIETVNELEEVGFDTIELAYEYNHLFGDEEIEILKDKKLDFSLHCPFIGIMFTHPNLDFSGPQIKLIENSLGIAVKLGCSHYVIHGGRIPATYSMVENSKARDFFVDLFIERFRDLFKKYSKEGLKILIENLSSEGKLGGKPSDIIKIKKAIPELGFCFDVAHSEVRKQTNELLEKIKVDYVHVTDNNLESDEHKAIGEGKIDFRKILSEVQNKGFTGKIILENLSLGDCKQSFNRLKEILKS